MTFKRPISYKGSAVVDATDFVIAYANDEHIAARIADALTNYGGSCVTPSEMESGRRPGENRCPNCGVSLE